MADHGDELGFMAPAAFEWDDHKSKANIARHGINFDDAIEIFLWADLTKTIGPQQ